MLRLPIGVLLAALATLNGCQCDAISQVCPGGGLVLQLPCPSAYEDVESIETHGEACGRAYLPGQSPQGLAFDSVFLEGAAAGSCAFVLVFRSGVRHELTAEFTQAGSCGRTIFQGELTSAVPQFCPDAGPCLGQTGCFVVPEGSGFGDLGSCSLFCPQDAGLSCAVPVMGARGDECSAACACVEGSFVDGCRSDSDCLLTNADCCGCARGGRSWAILAFARDKWELNICLGHDAGCNVVDYRCTPGARAVCDHGRCLIESPDAGP